MKNYDNWYNGPISQQEAVAYIRELLHRGDIRLSCAGHNLTNCKTCGTLLQSRALLSSAASEGPTLCRKHYEQQCKLSST